MWHMIQHLPGDMAHSLVALCFQCYEMAYVLGDMAHSFVAPCFQCYETAYVPGDMAHSFVALCFQSVAGLLHVAHDPASPWLHAPTVH